MTATIDDLDARQQRMVLAINWVENASGYDATIISADINSGRVAVYGLEARPYREKLKQLMGGA